MAPEHVFPENEPLIRALARLELLATDDGAQRELLGALLGAKLMVPSAAESQQLAEGGMLPAGARVGLVTFVADDAPHGFVPAFTDEGALLAAIPGGTPYLVLGFTHLADIVASGAEPTGIVLNPGSDEQLALSPHNVAALAADFAVPDVEPLTRDTEALVGTPAEPLPAEIARAIAQECARERHIERCWEFQWFVPDRHEAPTRVLCVELATSVPDADEVLSRFWARVQPTLVRAGVPIEMTAAAASFGELTAEIAPLYERAA